MTPPTTTQPAYDPYAGGPAAHPSQPYGTGGDPNNVGTWTPGRYTGAELFDIMKTLPEGAQLAFYRTMAGQGQGGNDLQYQAALNFGDNNKLSQWINANDAKNSIGYFNPATGEYALRDDKGNWSMQKLSGWNGDPYKGGFSSYGGQY